MFVVVVVPVLLGFVFHGYLPPNWPWGNVAIFLFAYMTFVTALEVYWRKFLHALTHLGVLLWMFCLIHLIMPGVAFLLARLFFARDFFTQLGFLIGATVPVGVTSIIWTSVTGGNTALALATVTLDTMLIPFWFPLFLQLIIGENIPVDYLNLFRNLLFMVTLPSVLGMSLTSFCRESCQRFAHSSGGFTSKIALALVVFINAARVAPEMQWNLGLVRMFLALFLLVMSGYSLGYLGSLGVRERDRGTRIAMVYNVGMRNLSFALVLAISYLPPLAAVPLTLLMLYQQPLAALVNYLLAKNAVDRARSYSLRVL